MKRILIYQNDENMIKTLDLLEAAGRMFGEVSFESFAVCINDSAESLMGYFDQIIHLGDGKGNERNPAIMTEALVQIHQKFRFDGILIPATVFGRMLAPRLAMALKTGLVADVTDIKKNKSQLEVIRPAYCGRILAGIEVLGQGPVMMSIRSDVFSFEGPRDRETEIISFTPEEKRQSRLKCLSSREKEKTYDIRESKVLISGGGGIQKDFVKLDSLAVELRGHVSASRRIVDRGLAPRAVQVGQSGKRVSPQLYVALGINGAMQHVEGLKNIENIVSVNINRNAPICSLSDIVVEGDAAEFIDKLLERIGKYKQKRKGEINETH